MGVVSPPIWIGRTTGVIRPSTTTVPRTSTTPRPIFQTDPITGEPVFQEPVEVTPVSQLETASKQGMTLSTPHAIPVEKLGGGGNRRQKDCTCHASHLCGGMWAEQKRSLRGLEYQLYVANLKSVPLVFSNLGLAGSGKSYKVTEWEFNGVNDYDGLWFKECTLVEAKDKYEHLFKWWWFDGSKELAKFERQMQKQFRAVQDSWKRNKTSKSQKVQLKWHFSEDTTYKKTINQIVVKALISKGLKVVHLPYMPKEERDKLENERKGQEAENNNRGFGV